MSTAQKRITKVCSSTSLRFRHHLLTWLFQEYGDLQKTPLEGIKISLVSEADLHQWQILMDGPKGSAYEVSHPNLNVINITIAAHARRRSPVARPSPDQPATASRDTEGG